MSVSNDLHVDIWKYLEAAALKHDTNMDAIVKNAKDLQVVAPYLNTEAQ